MAAHIICRFRHLSEKQKLINRIIASSNCWSGISDLHPKFTALSARHNLRKKKQMKSDFWQKKSPTTNRTLSNEKIKDTKEIISQMECIGTEADGGLATYGEKVDDYDSPRDFILEQAVIINDLKKFTETIGYSADQPRGQRTFQDMMEDFFSWWEDPHAEQWYDLARFYFDGHELTDKEREAL